MSDLQRGVVALDRFLVTSKTTLDNFKNYYNDFPIDLDIEGQRVIGFYDRLFNVYGMRFYIESASFIKLRNRDSLISDIKLIPYIKEIDGPKKSLDRFSYFMKRRAYCDAWLRKQLGRPITNNNPSSKSIMYEYSWGRVSYICLPDEAEDGVVGNKLQISYTDDPKFALGNARPSICA